VKDSEEVKQDKSWLKKTVDKALRFNRIFQVGTVCAALWFSYQSKMQSEEIEMLTLTNGYLLAQNRSESKAINETPFVWWKKELFPETGRIIMQNYNDAFYEYMLKPLNYGRYYYVRKEDKDVFSQDIAAVFYKEDFQLYLEFLKQPLNDDGERVMLIKEYKNDWVDLQGNLNKDGYWRFVQEKEGHIFIYGILNRPRKGKDKVIAYVKPVFVKPKKIELKSKVESKKRI